MRRPAGTTNKGRMRARSLASGSNTPLFLRACHFAMMSVKPPPQYDPRSMPMKEGTLIKPLIAGVMLYGGDWKTTHAVVIPAIRNTSVEENVRQEKIVAGD